MPRLAPLDPILDGAACGYLSIDETGTVRAANTTLAELIGRPRAQIEQHHIDTLLSPAGRIFYTTHLFPLLRLHRRAEEVYLPLRNASDEEIPVLVNGVARAADEGTLHDLIVVPVRQRNELESELIAAREVAQQAAAAKDRFLSIVSHELRTPLGAARGYAELLLRERNGTLTDGQRQYVQRILNATVYQASLIEDILDYAGQHGQRRTLEIETLELEDVMERAETLLAVRAGEEQRALRREPRSASGTLRGDPRAIQQILLNLGTNAIKFSPPDAEVLLTSDVSGEVVRIGVRDTGTGIPDDQLDRIFEPFVRVDSSAAASAKGLGLGLAISRDLARSMGGDITVESTLGEGSLFTLELPVG
ncbi:MAG: PAS domain-containing sensor histidine kinase [Chloroflexi bacterium]|nr:PAS domain-containing sensor histidine kinase [Chloroflexota bacterium]